MIRLCLRVDGPDGIVWVGVTPVTRDDWASFVRREAYFNPRWWLGATPEDADGDGLLRRTGFDWATRGAAVTGADWYEACAYCRAAGGRLPYMSEYNALTAYMTRRVPLGALRARFPEALSTPAGHRVPGGEWLADWYHPAAHGPDVMPDHTRRRRLGGGPLAAAAAHVRARPFGFRVVLPEGRCLTLEPPLHALGRIA